MNKRVKKKASKRRAIKRQNAALAAEVTSLKAMINMQGKMIEEMQNINSHNAQATNERFDKLEATNEKMKLDLDNAIISFSKSKKSSWFGRK
ncbi:hypothetical protein SORDD14_01685 [Streptococcus oralis]|uniref:Uncharacterized protein n=1 Tax=Streptococcus oralis TaxID=1303 RepID=A0A139NUR4_STROR|nr:hypothetical protein [Streptococcus oralis]KXT79583.1 hypothetical protein SORDD14_01685 [Streptococcus oralis]